MMPRNSLLTSLLLALFVAGCTSPSDPGPVRPPVTSELEPVGTLAVEVTRIPIEILYSIGSQKFTNETDNQTRVIVNEFDSYDGGPTDVGENATAILVEAQWTCQTPECRFVFDFQNGDDETIFRIYGNGPIRAEVPAEIPLKPGKWDAVVLPDSANIEVRGEIVVSVFYGGPVPDGYSAF